METMKVITDLRWPEVRTIGEELSEKIDMLNSPKELGRLKPVIEFLVILLSVLRHLTGS
jgi:hypothetical protein